MAVKKVSILGSTGSVGQSTVAVIAAQPELFDVRTLTAGRNVALLAQQARQLGARRAVVADGGLYAELKEHLSGSGIEAAAGHEALLESAAERCNLVVAAIVGFAGLEPIMKAIEAGSNLALANKEPLAAAGPQVMAAARRSKIALLPVDSEHNAIFQVFEVQQRHNIARIILTASGGPFRTWTEAEMEGATPEQAIAHPNWRMGRKISVDSASMMNKALEVVEAHYLFDMPPEKIDVLVHPQSVVHSMVEYKDGSILAQMGAPDMKTPIAYCLGWPDRLPAGGARLNLSNNINFQFEPIDIKKFKSVELSYECLRRGQAFCVAFNAANEVAVQAFLERRICFGGIMRLIQQILDKTEVVALNSVADVTVFDETVRRLAESYISEKAGVSERKGVYAA